MNIIFIFFSLYYLLKLGYLFFFTKLLKIINSDIELKYNKKLNKIVNKKIIN